jgi:3-hydroxyisobutyrate dehydrogenase
MALAKQLYVSLAATGGARYGIHALQLSLAKMSGIDWKNR